MSWNCRYIAFTMEGLVRIIVNKDCAISALSPRARPTQMTRTLCRQKPPHAKSLCGEQGSPLQMHCLAKGQPGRTPASNIVSAKITRASDLGFSRSTQTSIQFVKSHQWLDGQVRSRSVDLTVEVVIRAQQYQSTNAPQHCKLQYTTLYHQSE